MSAIGSLDAGVSSYVSALTGTSSTSSTTSSYGKSIGNVQLSDTAAAYYEELKQKYSNLDFVLVSEDEVNGAEAKASQYASGKTLVLIDVDKVEKMATDEDYRNKYENIITNASSQLEELAKSITSSMLGGSVKSYGIRIDDGGNASFFAVVDDSLKAQKERIEKKAEEKRAETKKQNKKDAEERLEKLREKNATSTDSAKQSDKADGSNLTTYTASSVEELLKKIQDGAYASLSDNVMTEDEAAVGGQMDLRI